MILHFVCLLKKMSPPNKSIFLRLNTTAMEFQCLITLPDWQTPGLQALIQSLSFPDQENLDIMRRHVHRFHGSKSVACNLW